MSNLTEAMEVAIEAARCGDSLDGIAEEYGVHPKLIERKLSESFGEGWREKLRSEGMKREQASRDDTRARALLQEQDDAGLEETWLKPGSAMTSDRFKRMARRLK